MRKKTDLEKVKEVAFLFAEFDFEQNKSYPFIVKHPFVDSTHVVSNDGKLLDLSVPADASVYRTQLKSRIESITSYASFSSIVVKSYRSAFLKHTKQYINPKDLAEYLKTLWVSTDTVNVDVNISKSQYVELFKKCEKEDLMTEEELKYYKDLPEEIIVYRGINKITNHPPKALSWTCDYNVAKWFSERFSKGNGIIYKTTVKKEDVLAYFSHEKEFVVDFRKLKNLEIVKKEV